MPYPIIVRGTWLKIAAIQDEDYQDNVAISSWSDLEECLRHELESKADIFTFSEKPDNPGPHFPYRYDLESIAAIPVKSYDDWWTTRVSTDLRKDVKRATKRGVIVRSIPFTDEFVHQIKSVYDETPVRQGRPFWHFQKPFETVRTENATYLERSEFLGAYFMDELIGFVKIVYSGKLGRLMQIIAKDAHRDKRPMNALIAKTVEVCALKGCTHLTYGRYRYYGVDSSLTAFKHRNGFEEILVPRYSVPLSVKGKVALIFGLHRGIREFIPSSLIVLVKRTRASIYTHRRFRTMSGISTLDHKA